MDPLYISSICRDLWLRFPFVAAVRSPNLLLLLLLLLEIFGPV